MALKICGYYWKAPWPTNAKGLHLFVGNVETNENYDLQTGLLRLEKMFLVILIMMEK